MAYTERLNFDATRHPNTSPGANGTTTGGGASGLIERSPGGFTTSINNGLISIAAVSGLGYADTFARAPDYDGDGWELNQKAEGLIPAGTEYFNRDLKLSCRCWPIPGEPNRHNGLHCWIRSPNWAQDVPNNNSIFIITMFAGLTGLWEDASGPFTLNKLKSYRAVLETRGVNPTTAIFTIREEATGTLVYATTQTFTEEQAASLSTTGFPAVGSAQNNTELGPDQSKPVLLKAVRFSDEPLVPPLTAGKPTVTRTAAQSVVASDVQNASQSATLQWMETALPDAPYSNVGTGQPTFTRSGLAPGTLRFYKYAVTDGPTTAISPILMVQTLLAALPAGPVRSDVPGLILTGIGDSIKRGYATLTNQASRLTQLGVPNVVAVQAAHSSSRLTIEWDRTLNPETVVGSYLQQAVAATEAALAQNPTYKVLWSIMLGTNDALNTTASKAQFAASLNKIVQLCQARGWSVELQRPPVLFPALFGMPSDATTDASRNARMRQQMEYWDACLEAIASNPTFVYLGDVRNWWDSYTIPNFISDGVHPSDAVGGPAMGRNWGDATRYGFLLAPALTAINITNDPANAQGQIQFRAVASPPGAVLENLQWSVPATEGNISASGLLTPTQKPAARPVTVTATSGSIQGQHTVTIPGNDLTDPTIVSVVVQADGVTALIVLSESCTGTDGFTFHVAGQARAATVVGTGTARTATFASVIYLGQSVTYSYAGDGLTDAGGRHPATVTAQTATNNSTQAQTPGPTAPVITTEPQGQALTEGQTLSLSVSATGTGPLSYQWRKNGANIVGATSAVYSKANVSTSDAGTYTVRVANAQGEDISAAATVTVQATNPNPNPNPNPTPGGSGTPIVALGRGMVAERVMLTAADGPLRLAYYADQPLPDGAAVELHLRKGGTVHTFAGAVVWAADGLVVATVATVPPAGDYLVAWEVAGVAYPLGFPIRLSIAGRLEVV